MKKSWTNNDKFFDLMDQFSVEPKEVEKKQIQILIDQCRGASGKALAEGVLTTTHWSIISEKLDQAESSLALLDFESISTHLNEAGDLLSL